MIEAAAPPSPGGPRPWWESRPFVVLLVLLAFVPLLWPAVPPLVDLPGHMARYKIAADLGQSPTLRQWYDFHWLMIGNLGVDLIAVPLTKWIGVEAATKLIVMTIPPMTVAGFLWVAREVHNRLPPTVLFALPFAYSHPFLFGFVNFSLSMALALLAFGLWLRLGRLEKTRLRALLFVPISFILYFCHTFGWGTLGLLAFSAEAVRQHDKGVSWWKAGIYAALHAAVMAGPLLMILLWRSEASGGVTLDWFNWKAKWTYVKMALRDRWGIFELVAVSIPGLVILFAILHRRLTLSRNLFFSALILSVCFALLPRIIFGSAYADMRLVPFIIAIAVLAIRFKRDTDMTLARQLAWAGAAFAATMLVATTISMAIADRDLRARLQALDHVPMGARVATLTGAPCRGWSLHTLDHLASYVVIRRDGFAGDQWQMSGSSLLKVHYPAAGAYQNDPFHTVRQAGCRREAPQSLDRALTTLPRSAFDYLWLIDPPQFDHHNLGDAQLVWQGTGSFLYRLPEARRQP